MLNTFKKLFSATNQPEEDPVVISSIISQIKERESQQKIPPGRRIHSLEYRFYHLYLDRDITKNYRITVNQGRERIYSFTIFANEGDYPILEKGYTGVIEFLKSEQKISELPDDDILKGFFYGH